MWTKLIRWWIQFNIWLGRHKPCEPQFQICITELSVDEVWQRLWNNGWSVNLTSYAFKGQVLTMRKQDGLNHQYHMRLYKDGHVEAHYEALFEATYEHSHEVDLRPLTLDEKKVLEEILRPH